MVRETLFRGKTDKNDNWVYGSLNNTDHQFPEIMYCDKNWSVCSTSIKPETIGVFTGLTDKNGTKIFEGDVVKVSGVAKAKIIWNNEDACFAFDYGKDGRPLCLDFIDDTGIEVIGNIYDNPDLLEEDK